MPDKYLTTQTLVAVLLWMKSENVFIVIATRLAYALPCMASLHFTIIGKPNTDGELHRSIRDRDSIECGIASWFLNSMVP